MHACTLTTVRSADGHPDAYNCGEHVYVLRFPMTDDSYDVQRRQAIALYISIKGAAESPELLNTCHITSEMNY